jgi:hypothetical protein
MRIGGEAPGGGANLDDGIELQKSARRTTTSDRYRQFVE